MFGLGVFSYMEEPVEFEAAFERLETILETMNAGAVSLDDSLKLYEEADKLIVTCHKRLTDAEQRIEVLIKKRNGELELDESNLPKREGFSQTPQNS